MKDITYNFDKVARLHCKCCGYDEHFVDVFFNKDLDSNDPDEAMFCFDFDIKNENIFPGLRERIRTVKQFFNIKFLREYGCVDSIMFSYYQLKELYEAMSEKAKYSIDLSIEAERPYIQLVAIDNFWDAYLFRGEDGLVLSSFSTSQENIQKFYENDFDIGWTYPKNYLNKYIKMNAINWLLKRSKSGIREYSCSLNKKETELFLLTLKYITENKI